MFLFFLMFEGAVLFLESDLWILKTKGQLGEISLN